MFTPAVPVVPFWKHLLNALHKTVTWVFFANVLIYISTRIINFVEDPYWEYTSSGGNYVDKWFDMFIQALIFIVLYNIGMSTYRLFIKQEYNNWKHWVTFALNFLPVFYIVVSM